MSDGGGVFDESLAGPGSDVKDQTYSPLFQEPNDAGELPTAREIKFIKISRILADAQGHGTRVKIFKSELRRGDGSLWELDKYKHDEEDIGEQLGGGRYFIQPIGHNGRPLPCGRTVFVPGPPRYRDLAEMNRVLGGTDGDSGKGEPMETARIIKAAVEEATRSKESPSMAQEISRVALSRDEASTDALRTLRDELSRKSDEHARATAEMIRSHAEDLRRAERREEEDRDARRKETDEAREEYAAKRRACQAETDEIKSQSRRDLDAAQRRFDRELEESKVAGREALATAQRYFDEKIKDRDQQLADERTRRVREVEETTKGVEERIAQSISRHQRRTGEAERDLEETRLRLTAEIDRLRKDKLALEKENIELRQELADGPANEEEAPAPSAPGSMTGPAMPWPVGMAEKYLGPIVERFMKNADQPQPQQPAQVPAQQIQSSPVYVAPVQNPIVYAAQASPVATAPAVSSPRAESEEAFVPRSDEPENDDEEDEIPDEAWIEG